LNCLQTLLQNVTKFQHSIIKKSHSYALTGNKKRGEIMNIKEYQKQDGSKGYKLNGAYIGIDSVTGEQVRTSIRGKSKAEIKRKLALKIREFEDNGSTKQAKVKIKTCNELIDLWLEYYKDSGIRTATYKQINLKINKHVRPLIADIKLDKLSHTLMAIKVTEFKKQIKGKLESYNTELAYMKAIFNFGVEKEFIKSNPMANIRTGKDKQDKSQDKAKRKKQIKYYNKEQIKKILDGFQPLVDSNSINDIVFVTYHKLLLFTGARASELLALEWSDIDFKAKTMSIDKTLSDAGKRIELPKTDTGIRTIELDQMAIDTLKQWQNLLYENCLKFGISKPVIVFYNISRQTNYLYAFLRLKYKNFCSKHDIPYLNGLHCFRHTHATMYVASGGDFKTLQARLGHEDISMTMNLYANALPEIERKAVENTLKFMIT